MRLDLPRQLRDLMSESRVFCARLPLLCFQFGVTVIQTLVFGRRFIELHAQLLAFELQLRDLRV